MELARRARSPSAERCSQVLPCGQTREPAARPDGREQVSRRRNSCRALALALACLAAFGVGTRSAPADTSPVEPGPTRYEVTLRFPAAPCDVPALPLVVTGRDLYAATGAARAAVNSLHVAIALG